MIKKKHRCMEFGRVKTSGYASLGDWIIFYEKGQPWLSVYDKEYEIEVSYCPFCGRKL